MVKFIVRMWNYFDGWVDVFGPSSIDECERYLKGKPTKEDYKGTYYKVFPDNTKMLWTDTRWG